MVESGSYLDRVVMNYPECLMAGSFRCWQALPETLRSQHLRSAQATRSFQQSFNGSFKVDVQGSQVTSDRRLIWVREWHERLRLWKVIAEHLSDSRHG